MARLGELLVALGYVTEEQCVQALQAQVLWGARLGTNLVELGLIDLDQLSRALGRQHGMPAALASHFENADRELQWRLPTEIAERYSCVPIGRATNGQIVVAAGARLDDAAREIVAIALRVPGARLTIAIAAELRIRYQLEQIYKLTRDTRFLRVRGPTPSKPPELDIKSVDVSGPELQVPVMPESEDDLAVARELTRPMFPRAGTAPITASTRPESAPPRPGSNPPLARPQTPPVTNTRPGSAPPIAQNTTRPGSTPPRPPIAAPRTLARAWPAQPPAARPEVPAPPPIAPEVAAVELFVELEQHVTEASLARAQTRDRRSYVPTLARSTTQERPAIGSVPPPTISRKPTAENDPIAVARMPLKRVAVGTEVLPPVSLGTKPPPISSTLGEATRAIRRSGNRDTIAHLVVQTVAQFVPASEAALVLIVRGPVAIAHAGFSRVVETLPEVVVPLDEPGLVAAAIRDNAPIRSGAVAPEARLGAVDLLLLAALGTYDDELLAWPIAVGNLVIGVVAVAIPGETAIAHADSITTAAGAAFARLMRDATR